LSVLLKQHSPGSSRPQQAGEEAQPGEAAGSVQLPGHQRVHGKRRTLVRVRDGGRSGQSNRTQAGHSHAGCYKSKEWRERYTPG